MPRERKLLVSIQLTEVTLLLQGRNPEQSPTASNLRAPLGSQAGGMKGVQPESGPSGTAPDPYRRPA